MTYSTEMTHYFIVPTICPNYPSFLQSAPLRHSRSLLGGNPVRFLWAGNYMKWFPVPDYRSRG